MNQPFDRYGGPGGRVPAWLVRLAGVAAAVVAALWLLGRRAKKRGETGDRAELEASLARRSPGQRFIVLAGRGRAGKSAVGNALLGTDLFGPDAPPDEAGQYRGPWWIRELPAAALSVADPRLLKDHLSPEDLVVLVVDEQLYHAERELLRILAEECEGVPRLVLINKADLLAAQYTAEEAAEIREDVVRAVRPWVADEADVVWGAAQGPSGADLEEFRARLEEVLEALE